MVKYREQSVKRIWRDSAPGDLKREKEEGERKREGEGGRNREQEHEAKDRDRPLCKADYLRGLRNWQAESSWMLDASCPTHW